jgi:hypothetical protein
LFTKQNVCNFRTAFEIDAVYLNARKVADLTSNLLMVGFKLDGHLSQEKRMSNLRIAGLIINNSFFYALNENTIIGIGNKEGI